MEPDAAHELLQCIGQDRKDIRTLIHGAGVAGDPTYVPWLVRQMEVPGLARLAGESFAFIAGLDLVYLDLDLRPPQDMETGPTENPEDADVALDRDGDLPWPDPAKVRAWWDGNGQQFLNGTRYFMGEPVTHEHCLKVLKVGYQRQRNAAAHYLCLLQPGTPLFNTSAPAWRQQRWLAKME